MSHNASCQTVVKKLMKTRIPVLFFLLTCTASLHSLGWETLSPSDEDDKYFFHIDSKITYTSYQFAPKPPARHSYTWIHLTGGYEVAPNFWISSWLEVQKPSFSYFLTYNPFDIHIYPQISYNNRHDFVQTNTDQEGGDHPSVSRDGLKINAKAGTIGDFTHGQGLFYYQFTGLGFQSQIQYKDMSLEVTWLGNGFDYIDDLTGFYFYPYKKIIGIGMLAELKTFLGNRIVPGLTTEFNLGKYFRVYGEVGVSYFFDMKYNHRTQTVDLTNYAWIPSTNISSIPLTIDVADNFFQSKDTLAGLFGIDFNFKSLTLVNQVRYYGSDNVEFYALHSQVPYVGFTYQSSLSDDQKYNNQPFNYYYFGGETLGFYFRQDLNLNPVKNFFLNLKNEILWVVPLSKNLGTFRVFRPPTLYWTATLQAYFVWAKRVTTGIQFSNVTLQQGPFSEPPGFGLLHQTSGVLIDIYAKYVM